MLRRLKAIIRKEFRQISRDMLSLWLLLFLPAFMLIMFGYAVTFDVKHIPMGLLDRDHSAASRDFADYFTRSEYFDLNMVLPSDDAIDLALDEGKLRVVLVIPPGFARHLERWETAPVQVLVDGTNAQSAATVLGYVNAVTQSYSSGLILERLARAGGRTVRFPLDIHPRIWYNPELLSARFMVPGLIGFIMMVTAVISTAMSVVRERERGTMEQLLVSPVRPLELILGKTLPYLFISLIGTGVILLTGYFLFGVVVHGSWLLLTAATMIFLVGSLGMGLLISTIAETQQVAFMISLLITLLPTFILSGFIFPIKNMPVVVQVVTCVVPARYYLVILRDIILKGVGLAAFWDQMVYLCIFALLMITVSSVRLKKKYDL